MNRYAYVLNNPTNFVDPSGLYWICPLDDCENGVESTEVGLPADPPTHCDVDGNWCVFSTGEIFEYNDLDREPGAMAEPIGVLICSYRPDGETCASVTVCSPVSHCEMQIGANKANSVCEAFAGCPDQLWQNLPLSAGITIDASRLCIGYGGFASGIHDQDCKMVCHIKYQATVHIKNTDIHIEISGC